MALSQSARDARRDSTLMRIGLALLDLIRKDAKRQRTSARALVENILRTAYPGGKIGTRITIPIRRDGGNK